MRLRVLWLALGGFLLVVASLAVSGVPPFTALGDMFHHSLATPPGWRGTLEESTPLLILGAAVFLALRAGLFNIGADGQFVVGAVAATWVALHVQGIAGILLAMLASVAAGALWALPAGLIKAYRNGHEVITTIMLNNIAFFLTLSIVNGPMKDAKSESPTSAYLLDQTVLPVIFRHKAFNVNIALVLAVLIVAALGLWIQRTVSGYELRATGANATAAKFAGVNVKRVVWKAMTMSGAMAGLAGAVQVLAYEKRFYAGFSPGYGFDALGAALLAGSSPWALFVTGPLFGVISKGTTALGLSGVPKGLSGIMLGVIVICFSAYRYRKEARGE